MQFNLGISGINIDEWKKVIYGLILSAILGFLFGYIITKIVEKICKNIDRRKATTFFKKTQFFGGRCNGFYARSTRWSKIYRHIFTWNFTCKWNK